MPKMLSMTASLPSAQIGTHLQLVTSTCYSVIFPVPIMKSQKAILGCVLPPLWNYSNQHQVYAIEALAINIVA
jgi:hypothetical protein